jgi:hypothetical protein
MLGIVLAALVSGCALEAGESATLPTVEPTQKAGSAFDASLFKFNVQRPDDGRGLAGGWQVASTVLTFEDLRTSVFGDKWQCRVTIGMPIRHSLFGVIPPDRAAELSANTAIVASDQVMKTRPKWITGLFCKAFADKMLELFNVLQTGAKVTSP